MVVCVVCWRCLHYELLYVILHRELIGALPKPRDEALDKALSLGHLRHLGQGLNLLILVQGNEVETFVAESIDLSGMVSITCFKILGAGDDRDRG